MMCVIFNLPPHPINAIAMVTIVVNSSSSVYYYSYLDDCGKRMVGFGSEEISEEIDEWLTTF